MSVKNNKNRTQWNVKAADIAKFTYNPIRSIVEGLKIAPHPDKPMIALSIGESVVFVYLFFIFRSIFGMGFLDSLLFLDLNFGIFLSNFL